MVVIRVEYRKGDKHDIIPCIDRMENIDAFYRYSYSGAKMLIDSRTDEPCGIYVNGVWTHPESLFPKDKPIKKEGE